MAEDAKPDDKKVTPAAAERKEERREASQDFLLQFFTFAHLPVHLAEVSEPFCRLAQIIVNSLPANPERTVALRKLLESKDCAVRALVARR